MAKTIVDELRHAGALFRVRGLFRCMKKSALTSEQLTLIRSMLDDQIIVAGYPVNAYARAVLVAKDKGVIGDEYTEVVTQAMLLNDI